MKKKAVARVLAISRNTLKKYWDEPLPGKEQEGPNVTENSLYHTPWSETVDWENVRKAGLLSRHLDEPKSETL